MESLIVRDVMDASIVPLRLETSLAQAVDQIIDSHHLGLPVVDGNHRLVGFLSEQDCMKYVISGSYYADSLTRVGDIMRPEPLKVGANDSLLALAERMQTGKPKNYPVCDEGKLVGLVTRSAVLRALNEKIKTTKIAI
ncbi:MAG TPA: CBS domain-containing protein [Marinobacterium sp.]|nr:CBS domain-containing protein [Marinobacterium sp.]